MKNQRTYILGINTTYHELSACLLEDGQLVAAVEEERFSRIKHGKSALIDNPDVLPIFAIEFCLKQAGISLGEVDHIGLSFCPKLRLANIGADKYFDEGDWASKSGENLFYQKLLTVPRLLSQEAGENIEDKIVWVDHHISHAGSAYYVSGYSDSAILSIDGIGEITSTWLGKGDGNHMSLLKEIQYPNSVGFLWEKFCKFMGFSDYDAQKLMGLASYGDPSRFRKQFDSLVTIAEDGDYKINNEILRFRKNDYSQIEKVFGVKKLVSPDERQTAHEDIAAGLQSVTDEIILNLCQYLAKETNSKNISMAGGVALNCVSNYEIMKSGLFNDIYIQPAAHDGGTALGAAFHIWHDKLGHQLGFRMKHAYWGPSYSDREIESVLEAANVNYQKVNDVEAQLAARIADGAIVGWFQGKLEWGPRALGHRSLLVDPRDAEMKEVLNYRIKKREPFRPFAPSVLAEDAADWFEIPTGCKSISTEFMEFTFPVRKDKADSIPAVTHVDGTSRIQVVSKVINPKYHRLISEFKKLTGVPMLLNTSFNDNEPIVCSPKDALNTFLRTKMDYLALGDFLVAKAKNPETSLSKVRLDRSLQPRR